MNYLNVICTSRTRMKILAHFACNPEPISSGELIKVLHEDRGNVNRLLHELLRSGMIIKTVPEYKFLYSANPECPAWGLIGGLLDG